MHIPVKIDEASIEELLEIITEESKELVNCAKKCKYVNSNKEIHRLLDDDNLRRYEAVNSALYYPLNGFDYELNSWFDEILDVENLGRLIQAWITLGSALESSMQIFLAIYLNDYKNSNWGKWEDFNFETVKSSISELLVELRDKNHIKLDNVKTLNKEIKNHLKSKNEITKLENLNLQNLINFFESEVKWEKEVIDALNKIRMNRNAVHSFKQRQIDNWDYFIQSLKVYCKVLLDLQGMMPPFDDVIDMIKEYERDCYNAYSDYY